MLQGVTTKLSVNESNLTLIPILTNASNHAFLIHRRYQSRIVVRASCTLLHVNLKRILHMQETANRHWSANNNNTFMVLSSSESHCVSSSDQCRTVQSSCRPSDQAKRYAVSLSVGYYGLQSHLLVRITQPKSRQACSFYYLIESRRLRQPRYWNPCPGLYIAVVS